MANIFLFLILIVAVIVIAGLLIFRFGLKILSKPVLDINLTPLETAKWSDKQKASDLTDWFLRNGFEHAGLYESFEMPGLVISGFVLPSEQTLGIIYDHPIAGIWVDLCEEYTDGGSLTVSNASTGQSNGSRPRAGAMVGAYCHTPLNMFQSPLPPFNKGGRSAPQAAES